MKSHRGSGKVGTTGGVLAVSWKEQVLIGLSCRGDLGRGLVEGPFLPLWMESSKQEGSEQVGSSSFRVHDGCKYFSPPWMSPVEIPFLAIFFDSGDLQHLA